MNFRKSVLRPAPGAGAPSGKSQYVTIVYVDDIDYFPPSDTNGGVMLQGNIVLKPGAKMEKIYQTPESQKASHKFEGESDSEGFLKSFEGTHPGDELEINEFVQNNIGVPVILIYPKDCNTGLSKVLGLPCSNPLYLKPEFEDTKDGVKHTLKYEQSRRDRFVAKFYTGDITYRSNLVIASGDVPFLKSNGSVVELPPFTAPTNINIISNDFEHKKIVTIVGGGGTIDATLANGLLPSGYNVLLDNGIPWVAYKGAVINFQVFDTGPVINFIEISRK